MLSEWLDEQPYPGPSEWHDLYVLPADAGSHTRETQVAYLIMDFGDLTFKEFLYQSGINLYVNAYDEKLGTYVFIDSIEAVHAPDKPSYIRVECSYVCIENETVICGLPYLYTILGQEEEWPPPEQNG